MNWRVILDRLKAALEHEKPPAAERIMREKPDPFRVLISTMISPRTKDEVTLAASERLFNTADSPGALANLSETTIAKLIYPAGFYATKARHIKITSGLIMKNGGKVPDTLEELLAFPGVGRKTANLVLSVGFGKPAICVDTHVHRISNRMGWVDTDTPGETERELMRKLPIEYWGDINRLLVSYGQRICTPVSPFCSSCDIRDYCERRGVLKSR